MLRNKDHLAPVKTFRYSITYLMLLFLIMLVDHYIYPVSTL
jgi:protoheme IX farnesyltransferase